MSSCAYLDWQISSVAPIFDELISAISGVEHDSLDIGNVDCCRTRMSTTQSGAKFFGPSAIPSMRSTLRTACNSCTRDDEGFLQSYSTGIPTSPYSASGPRRVLVRSRRVRGLAGRFRSVQLLSPWTIIVDETSSLFSLLSILVPSSNFQFYLAPNDECI